MNLRTKYIITMSAVVLGFLVPWPSLERAEPRGLQTAAEAPGAVQRPWEGVVPPSDTLVLDGPADDVVLAPAERLETPTTTTAPPPILGLHGLPIAPYWLHGCEEMEFYRVQAGLPDRFDDSGRHQQWVRTDGYGWRETKCDNEAVSFTGCCVGYWQVHTGNFTAPGYRAGIAACEVSRRSDILGPSPLQKQKQACVTKVLFDVSGHQPWG